jgi:hypothetical protein
MSRRIGPSWLVFRSVENDVHDRCVDLFSRPDGSFGFEEFRQDVEDQGAWTPVGSFSGGRSRPVKTPGARRAEPFPGSREPDLTMRTRSGLARAHRTPLEKPNIGRER